MILLFSNLCFQVIIVELASLFAQVPYVPYREIGSEEGINRQSENPFSTHLIHPRRFSALDPQVLLNFIYIF